MKKYFVLFLVFLSCGNSELRYKTIKSGFINEPGIYTNPYHKRNILVKELKDGSMIFAIRNSENRILFQQSLNETFSMSHYWVLYVDKNMNVWYYNSDYDSSQAILFDKKTQQYKMINFCTIKLELPKEFKKELELKNSFGNCVSLTEIKK